MAIAPETIERLKSVLDRKVEIGAAAKLRDAFAHREGTLQLQGAAIGWDTNILLNLSRHKKREEVVDWFASRHTSPFIVPGQVLQEFWNGQYSKLHGLATNIKSKFDALGAEIEKIDDSFAEFKTTALTLLNDIVSQYGYVRDQNTLTSLGSICEMIANRARTDFVPRSEFHGIAKSRESTKTPPGFKDDGDGDFFVWADFLASLVEERTEGANFDRVILVTEDQKMDWSAGSAAHPILVAEVDALLDARFEIWGLEKLVRAIDSAIAPTATPVEGP